MTSAKTDCRVIGVDGVRLYADTRAGTNPALVFLHYWGGSRRTWQPVLARLHPDQAFVNYDQRGWGESANASGPYDVRRLADDVQSVIATVGHTDYVLVGHSMGGKVAQALAARRPAGLAGARGQPRQSRATGCARRPPTAPHVARQHDRARGHRSSVASRSARPGGLSHHGIHRAAQRTRPTLTEFAQ